MTALEFIEQQYNYNGKLTPVDFYQAIEMEKQQIIDAHKNGAMFEMDSDIYAKQYYNETYLSRQDKP